MLIIETDKQNYRLLPPWNDWPLEPVTVMMRKVMHFQMAFLSEQSADQGRQCIPHTRCALLGIAGTLNENQILKANHCLDGTGKPNCLMQVETIWGLGLYLVSITNWNMYSGSEQAHRLGHLHCLLAWDETLASMFLKTSAEFNKTERFNLLVSNR